MASRSGTMTTFCHVVDNRSVSRRTELRTGDPRSRLPTLSRYRYLPLRQGAHAATAFADALRCRSTPPSRNDVG